MVVDVLRTIKETEQEAERMITQSAADGRQIVSEANNQARTLLEQELYNSEQEAASIIEKAEQNARSRIKDLQKQADLECAGLASNAKSKMDLAGNNIIGRLLKAYGNS